MQLLLVASLAVGRPAMLQTSNVEQKEKSAVEKDRKWSPALYLADRQHVDQGRQEERRKREELEELKRQRAAADPVAQVCEDAKECAANPPLCVEQCRAKVTQGDTLIPAYCQRVLGLAEYKGGKYIYEDLHDSEDDRQEKYIRQLYTYYCKLPPVSPDEGECFAGTVFSGDPDFPALSWTPSGPGYNCLPVRIPYCEGTILEGDCHSVINLPLQYGCGGIRGRMNCDNKTGLMSAGRTDSDEREPALIPVKELPPLADQ